jgi:hypothetical protein
VVGDGAWVAVLDGLRADSDGDDEDGWIVGEDATVIRVHAHAAGARKAPSVDIEAQVLAPTVLSGG